MSITRSQVDTVAQLSRLKIDEAEIEQYVSSLSSILDLVDEMQTIDTSTVEPLANPLDATQRLRTDEVSETNNREHLQQNAPLAEAGLFLVPKVIE